MADERDQLSPDEFVLRRVPKEHVINDSEIEPDHFIPDKVRDKDGLSIFRENLKSPISLIANAMGRGPYSVYRIEVRELNGFGLTLTTDGDHVSIEDLKPEKVKADDRRATQIQKFLATHMRRVIGPLTPEEAKKIMLDRGT